MGASALHHTSFLISESASGWFQKAFGVRSAFPLALLPRRATSPARRREPIGTQSASLPR
jgi:hypothetical protein